MADGTQKSFDFDEVKNQARRAEGKLPLCTCVQDPFASLPSELMPTPVKRDFGLHKVACPNCGFFFWTNRKTDLHIECEKKAVKLPAYG